MHVIRPIILSYLLSFCSVMAWSVPNDIVVVRDKAAVEQCYHPGCVRLALLCFLVCYAPHWLGRVWLRAPQDLLHSGLQQGRQVQHIYSSCSPHNASQKIYLCVYVLCSWLGVSYTEPLFTFFSIETMFPTWSPCPSSTWPSRCLLSCPLISPLHRNLRRPETPG